MASGEAEPLQYTTTVLRVSIHCEGCKKKVKKVLHSIEGVYKVAIDAAQHKVTVTGSVGADALVRRLQKAGKQAALWPTPAPAAEADKKPEEVAAAAGDGGKDVNDKADAKPKEKKGADKKAEPESSVKKPEKDKAAANKKPEKDNGAEKEKGSEKEPEKAESLAKLKDGDAKKDKDVAAEPKEKGSPEPPPKEAVADQEASAEEGSAKKGKKKNKNKPKDGGDGGEAEKPPPQPAMPALGPHGAFPYYAAQPVMSYNVTHPSASVSYYAPTPAMPMPPPPPPPHVPYGYPPYPPMMPPPPMPEYMYGPPGMRSSPPHESYNNNMFDEENANSCSLM